MTREEALEWFKDRKKMNLDDKCQQAEDIAIKALEQEPVVEPLERLAESASKTAKALERLKVSEQEPILDKIRAEIEELHSYVEFDEDIKTSFNMVRLEEVQRVIDKYKAESEDYESRRSNR